MSYLAVEPRNELLPSGIPANSIIHMLDMDGPDNFDNAMSILANAKKILICELPKVPKQDFIDSLKAIGIVALITCHPDHFGAWWRFCETNRWLDRVLAVGSHDPRRLQ